MRATMGGLRGAILRDNTFVDAFVDTDTRVILEAVIGDILRGAAEDYGNVITITINTEKNPNG